MSREYTVGDRAVSIVARPDPGVAGEFEVVIDGSIRRVSVQQTADGAYLIRRSDGSRYVAYVSRDPEDARARWVTIDGTTQRFDEADLGGGDGGHNSGLEAPMPGTVFEVCVSPGQRVEEGATLLIVEAMKMEHAIIAPAAGVIESVDVKAGDRVSPGKPLVAFEEQ